MVENFTCLSLIESEVECKGGYESSNSNEQIHIWHISVTVGVERIVSDFISVRLVMSIWLIDYQVSVGIW